MEPVRLDQAFFKRDVLEVAPDLVGKLLCCGGKVLRITETEAYRGEEDTACHASRGRTARTETLYQRGGTIYVYLCYGIHELFNVVTGEAGQPQAVLIRACEGQTGPGKLTKALGINRRYNGLDITQTPDLCLASDGWTGQIRAATRVGIDYAAKEDREKLWRFILN
ncbi:MAG: DNA-3-methyladenine glycosylase [Clostridiales bacterium]|nr:DNA-3-methyladenine glycosylase [Clostridiales bacterium]